MKQKLDDKMLCIDCGKVVINDGTHCHRKILIDGKKLNDLIEKWEELRSKERQIVTIHGDHFAAGVVKGFDICIKELREVIDGEIRNN